MRHGPTPLAALAAAALIAAAGPADDHVLPDGALGTRVAPMLLLSRPDVRTDLGLDPAQVESARATLADLWSRAKGLQGRGDGPEVVARRRAIDEIQWRWLDTHLADEQRRRLYQIDLQWEGELALLRAEVVEALGLTADQAAGLRRAAVARVPAAHAGRLEAALTTDQRDRWREMLGPRLAVVESPAGRPDPAVSRAAGGR